MSFPNPQCPAKAIAPWETGSWKTPSPMSGKKFWKGKKQKDPVGGV